MHKFSPGTIRPQTFATLKIKNKSKVGCISRNLSFVQPFLIKKCWKKSPCGTLFMRTKSVFEPWKPDKTNFNKYMIFKDVFVM